MKKIIKTDEEWRELLNENEFLVTRKKGTEPAFSGKSFDPNKFHLKLKIKSLKFIRLLRFV